MIRVAAHKLGSISSSPQSATVLTVLTQPTDLQGQLHSPQLFHWLSNWHLFTWLLIHSIPPTPQPTYLPPNVHNRSIPSTPHCFRRREAVVCTGLHHTHVICWQRIWMATGTLQGVKMKSVLVIPQGREMRRPWCVSVMIARKKRAQSVSVSFSRHEDQL